MRPISAFLPLFSSLLLAAVVPSRTAAQIPAQETPDPWAAPAVSDDVANRLLFGAEPFQPTVTPRTPRISMFHMLPGFLSEPMTILSKDSPVVDDADSAVPDAGAGSMEGLVVSMGAYNPYFDLRRPGDPGGVGYNQLHSQLQVVELPSTSVCLGVRAWTPAGLDVGGVQDGPTTVAPGLGVFHDLGYGAGLHGYVDQNFQGVCKTHGPLQYGMGVQCPLTPWAEPSDGSLYFFVEAVGNYDYVGASYRQGRPQNWDVVPGLHWRVNDTFSMSFGATRSSMVTWMWQF
jgi:hypothetical protein